MSETLLHYSSSPLLTVEDRGQDDEPFFKPNGLWVSTEGEDGWKAWCESARWNLAAFTNTYRVVLSPLSTILRLCSEKDLYSFAHKYNEKNEGNYLYNYIYWNAVAADYDGIIISPYQAQSRFHPTFFWYSTWDCASGCIWNSSAIEKIELISTREEISL